MQPRLQTERKPTGGRSAGTSECVRDLCTGSRRRPDTRSLRPRRLRLRRALVPRADARPPPRSATSSASSPRPPSGVTQVGRTTPAWRPIDSLEELAAAGAEAVAISTPAATHSELTDRALELGLAVVCDKPFALDAAAARRSVELAERLGLPLSPYQNRRWDSDFLTVRRLVADGVLGELVPLRVAVRAARPRTRAAGASGGGTLLRLRQPPGRPGARAARTGRLGLRRVAAARRTAWTTTSSSR